MAESEKKLKNILMQVKEEGEKAGLKLNIKETKIMASSPIILWQIDGENVETVTDLIFLGFKLTVKKKFIGPGLHLRPVRADCAHGTITAPPPWTLNSLLSACGNDSGRIRPPPDREP